MHNSLVREIARRRLYRLWTTLPLEEFMGQARATEGVGNNKRVDI